MFNQQASFWDPENGQDSDVVRHAPDDDNYHYPDGRQSERMRFGMGQAIVVPKARNDGRSMAFDGTKADVVHVDPNAPDGGVIVDLTQVSKADMYRAVASSRYPHEAFYKLGVSPGELSEEAPQRPRRQRRENPLIGSGYVVPASDIHGRQVWEAPQNEDYGNFKMAYPKEGHVLPAAPQLPPAQQQPQQAQGPQATQVAMPAPYPPPHYATQPPPAAHMPQQQYPQQGYPPAHYQQPYFPPPPPPPTPQALDPNLQAMLGQIVQSLSAVSSRLQAVEDQPRPARETRPRLRNGVSSVPVGDRDRDEFRRPVPIGHAPRRRKQAEEEDIYADQTAKPVFEDDAEEIGTRKNPHEQRPRTRRRAAPPPPQHLDEYIEEDDEDQEFRQHREGIIVGFESLRIPFIAGPTALKPKRRVMFDFGHIKQQATYHDVIESMNNVTLVYDTRYEDGVQCEPPDLGPEKVIEMHVPSLKKTYRVGSIGQSFSLGVLDFVVLVKVDNDQELDYDEES